MTDHVPTTGMQDTTVVPVVPVAPVLPIGAQHAAPLLDLRSHDIAEDKRQALLHLFPEIRTEGGKIDFERLKLALGETVDVGKERYGMHWPGKADCFLPATTSSRPTPRRSSRPRASPASRPCEAKYANYQRVLRNRDSYVF